MKPVKCDYPEKWKQCFVYMLPEKTNACISNQYSISESHGMRVFFKFHNQLIFLKEEEFFTRKNFVSASS